MRVLSIIIVLFIFSCDKKKPEWSDHEAGSYVDKELLKDVKIMYSDSGKISIVITAPVMVRFTESYDQKQEFPKGFQAKFYNEQKELINILSSKYALRSEKEHKTTMKDSVVFSSLEDETLKTSELIWDESAGKLLTDKYVRISRKDELIHGYGFETDENFKTGQVKLIDAIIPSDKLIDKESLE